MSEASQSPRAERVTDVSLEDGPARVQRALDKFQSGLHVQIFHETTDTASAAAQAAGCLPGQIVKSMLFMADREPVLLLIAGDRRVDTGRLALLLGIPRKRIRMAAADEVFRLTGYEVGAVSPLGHPHPLETLIDSSLDRFDVVYAAAGSVHALFASGPALLQRLSSGRKADVSV